MARAKEGSKKRQLEQARATDADADADCVVTGEGFGTGGVLAGAEDGVVRPGGATKGAGKRQGEKAFAQTQCRGTWGDSEITCAFCYDSGLEHVPYAQRPAFTVHPTLFVGPDYVRDEAKDPKPVLEAARKNASRNKSDNTNLVAGDVLTRKVYSQACGARCTSRCWSHAWPQAAHSPSCLAHVPRVASRRTPRPPPPGARTTRGMHTARAATGRHMCHTWQQRTGPCGACAMRGMHTARSAPGRTTCHAWHLAARPHPRPGAHATRGMHTARPPLWRIMCHAWHLAARRSTHPARSAPCLAMVPRVDSLRAPLEPRACTFCPVPVDSATRGLFNQAEDDDLHNEVHTEVRANCPHVAHPIRPTGHAWLSGGPHVLEPLSESEMQRVAQYYQFINRPLDQFIDRPLG